MRFNFTCRKAKWDTEVRANIMHCHISKAVTIFQMEMCHVLCVPWVVPSACLAQVTSQKILSTLSRAHLLPFTHLNVCSPFRWHRDIKGCVPLCAYLGIQWGKFVAELSITLLRLHDATLCYHGWGWPPHITSHWGRGGKESWGSLSLQKEISKN